MNPSQVPLLAFLIGVIAGLCSLTATALVAWAAHRYWLNLHTAPSRTKPTRFARDSVAIAGGRFSVPRF